ncbi:hypothetical protein C0991_002108 [Blastosporella zonata]|nr:hypothetical protein C0991_002108 [Blastosporella zonata]
MPGFHELDPANVVGLVAHFAPIIRHLEITLKASALSVESGPVPLFLIAPGLRQLKASDPSRASELLKQGYAIMKQFNRSFNVGTEAANTVILSEKDEELFTSLSLHHDRNLAGKIPMTILAHGPQKPINLASDQGDQIHLQLDYKEWQHILTDLSSLGLSSWVTGAATFILRNEMSLNGDPLNIIKLPPLEFTVTGTMHLRYSDPAYKFSTPSWAAPLSHHITNHREKALHENKVQDLLATRNRTVAKGVTDEQLDTKVLTLVDERTTKPVVPTKPDKTLKSPSLEDLTLQTVRAFCHSMDSDDESHTYVIGGRVALYLMGSKKPIDKVDILFLKGITEMSNFFNSRSKDSLLIVDYSSPYLQLEIKGEPKNLPVEAVFHQRLHSPWNSAALFNLGRIEPFVSIEGSEYHCIFAHAHISNDCSVRILQPVPLLIFTLLRWVLTYMFIYQNRPSLLLLKRFVDETEDVRFLLDYILADERPAERYSFEHTVLEATSILSWSYEHIQYAVLRLGMPQLSFNFKVLDEDYEPPRLPDQFLAKVVALFCQFYRESDQDGELSQLLRGQWTGLLSAEEINFIVDVEANPDLAAEIFGQMFAAAEDPASELGSFLRGSHRH